MTRRRLGLHAHNQGQGKIQRCFCPVASVCARLSQVPPPLQPTPHAHPSSWRLPSVKFRHHLRIVRRLLVRTKYIRLAPRPRRVLIRNPLPPTPVPSESRAWPCLASRHSLRAPVAGSLAAVVSALRLFGPWCFPVTGPAKGYLGAATISGSTAHVTSKFDALSWALVCLYLPDMLPPSFHPWLAPSFWAFVRSVLGSHCQGKTTTFCRLHSSLPRLACPPPASPLGICIDFVVSYLLASSGTNVPLPPFCLPGCSFASTLASAFGFLLLPPSPPGAIHCLRLGLLVGSTLCHNLQNRRQPSLVAPPP